MMHLDTSVIYHRMADYSTLSGFQQQASLLHSFYGSACRCDLAGYLWLSVSHELVVKLLVGAMVASEGSNMAGVSAVEHLTWL